MDRTDGSTVRLRVTGRSRVAKSRLPTHLAPLLMLAGALQLLGLAGAARAQLDIMAVAARPPAVMPAFDDVENSLPTRNELSFPKPVRLPAQVAVHVGSADGTLTANAVVPAGQVAVRGAEASRPASDSGSAGALWLLAIGVGVFIVVLGAVMLLAAWRARTRDTAELERRYRGSRALVEGGWVRADTTGTEIRIVPGGDAPPMKAKAPVRADVPVRAEMPVRPEEAAGTAQAPVPVPKHPLIGPAGSAAAAVAAAERRARAIGAAARAAAQAASSPPPPKESPPGAQLDDEDARSGDGRVRGREQEDQGGRGNLDRDRNDEDDPHP